MLWLHVAGGALGLVAGFTALYTAKGSETHRWFGRVFVYAMLAMALSGAVIAALTNVDTSVAVGMLTAYLVFTGWTTVVPLTTGRTVIGVIGVAIALAVAVGLADLGRRALATPSGVIEGMPASMAFVFSAVALCAGVSDIRWLAGHELRGSKKVSRHLWRMCIALFIASASYFLGQMSTIPAALRHPVLLVIPVLTPLLVMLFWLWRTRSRRPTADINAPSHAGST